MRLCKYFGKILFLVKFVDNFYKIVDKYFKVVNVLIIIFYVWLKDKFLFMYVLKRNKFYVV